MLRNFNFKVSVTNENQIQCPRHSHIINKIQTDSTGLLEFYCDECWCPTTFRLVERDPIMYADKEHQFCTISFSDLSAPTFSPDQENTEGNVMDFRSLEIEHVIVDNRSQGYSPRNLVYVSDENALVACSSNGNVALWSIGEAVQLRNQFNLEKPIRFAKYINRRECGNSYLILGADTQLYVYVTNQLIENNLSVVSMMNCEFEVYDVEWISRGDKIVVSGNGNLIQIWDVKTFSLERTIDVEAYGTTGPIYRVIYLKHTNLLALENMAGVSLINVEKEGIEIEGLPKHFHISDRELLGLAYLPKSRCFLLRGNSQMEVLDEESFTLRERSYTYPTVTDSSQLLDSRMLINEDESQCMTSNPPQRLFIYFQDGTFSIVQIYNILKESGALEVIKDQHRIVVGGQDSGALFIMRTNAREKSYVKMNQISYPQVFTQNQAISSNTISKSKRGAHQSARRSKAKSKDQLKERAAKKTEDRSEIGEGRKTRSQAKKEQEKIKKGDSRSRSKDTKTRKTSQSGRMEIENAGQNNSKPTRKTRSQTKKEKGKTKKEDSKLRNKSKSTVRKTKEEEEEKMKDRSKSRKGKKK